MTKLIFFQILELFATIFENVVFVDFITRFLGTKKGRAKTYLGMTLTVLIAVVFITVVNQYYLFEGFLGIISIIIFVCYELIYLKGSLFPKILLPVFLYCIIFCINLSVNFIFVTLGNNTSTELVTQMDITRLLGIVITKLLFFLTTRIILQIMGRNKISLKKEEWVGISALFSLSFILWIFIADTNFSQSDNNFKNAHIPVAVISVFIINIITFYLMEKIANTNEKNLRISILEVQVQEQVKMVENIKLMYTEIRKSKHDLKNHLMCISELVKNDKKEEALEYIEKITKEKAQSNRKYILTDNDAFNAIINLKISKCAENNIDIDYCISGSLSKFESMDICIIIANLLDNAIEASMKVKNPKIKIMISDKYSYLNINVSNNIDDSVLNKNYSLTTTKSDKKNHGLGLLTISDVTDKYDGIKNFIEHDGKFIVDILLKIPA